MNKTLICFSVIIGIVIAIIPFSIFRVHEVNQALILQFGDVKRMVTKPGLYLKIPFVQHASYFERRVISLDPPVELVILADKKRLILDAISRYRIINPLQFYINFGTEYTANIRLGAIINSALRDVLGRYSLKSMLNSDRDIIIKDITNRVRNDIKTTGIALLDVRIRRADLPDQTSQAVFERMRAERIREAKEFRAEGYEIANEIRSRADRDVQIIISQAKKTASIIKADADSKKFQILRKVMDADPKFAKFFITMESYSENIADANTSMILSTKIDYFRYLEKIL